MWGWGYIPKIKKLKIFLKNLKKKERINKIL